MSPKTRSKISSTRSCKKSKSKVGKTVVSKRSPMNRRCKLRSDSNTPKIEETSEPIASTSYELTCSTPKESKNSRKNESLITPKVMKYCLNAYKESPDYLDLKKKRFNTSFVYESPRGSRDIEIFTPEEDSSLKWNDDLPVVKNKIEGVPGEKYADIFMSIPGLDVNDVDEEIKLEKLNKEKNKNAKKGKRGRKKSIGYKGVPLPDEYLLFDYSDLISTPTCYLDMEKVNSCSSSNI